MTFFLNDESIKMILILFEAGWLLWKIKAQDSNYRKELRGKHNLMDPKQNLLKEKSSAVKKGKNLYDMIHSEELDLLYRKNAHLLDRLSKTGKENTLLYTKLSSLNKEKSHLGNKNTVLQSKCSSLKEQISLFARQHREFNYQSLKLKKQLKKTRELKAQDRLQSPAYLEKEKKREKSLQLFQKKETVYKNQIQNLQTLCHKLKNEKQTELKYLTDEHNKNILSLEKKIKTLYQTLVEERNKQPKNNSLQLKKIKTANQKLNKKLKSLEGELKFKNKNYKLLLESRNQALHDQDQMKSVAKKHLEDIELASQKVERLQKQNNIFKKKESQWNKKLVSLKKGEKWVKIETRKIKSYKQEISRLKAHQEHLEAYKSRTGELKRQNEKLKSDFTEQFNLLSKERAVLKLQCESLKKALAGGKAGFEQAMLSFQRKHIKLHQNHEKLKKQTEEKTHHIQNLEKSITQFKNKTIQEKQEWESQIKRERNQHIGELKGELTAVQDHNQDLERQIQNLKANSKELFLKEKQILQKEVQELKWSKEQSLLKKEESHKKEIAGLKLNYDKQIQNLETLYRRKLQHIQTEMENDLCSERKRYEIFKDMKTKNIKELKENFKTLQTENHELKTKHFVLEKSLKETKARLNQYLKNHTNLEGQNANLKALWQDLHKQNETKDQQIKSLQKLNKALSLSLNENKRQTPAVRKKIVFSNVPEIQKDLKEEQPSSRVLADIHFD